MSQGFIQGRGGAELASHLALPRSNSQHKAPCEAGTALLTKPYQKACSEKSEYFNSTNTYQGPECPVMLCSTLPRTDKKGGKSVFLGRQDRKTGLFPIKAPWGCHFSSPAMAVGSRRPLTSAWGETKSDRSREAVARKISYDPKNRNFPLT